MGEGGTPLVLRKWWDVVHQSLGRGESQTFVTQRGVEDELLENTPKKWSKTGPKNGIKYSLKKKSNCPMAQSIFYPNQA